ncbi:hypothetical protein Hanom_Chr07g00635561 [Helianthus anomalus]
MEMARFQTFWIQMRKNKHLDESRKSGQTSGTKTTFYSLFYFSWAGNGLKFGDNLQFQR